MKPALIIIGNGGHASVLTEILLQQNRKVVCCISPEAPNRAVFDSIPRLSFDEDIIRFNPSDVILVNGVGALPNSKVRENVANKFRSMGYKFENVIANTAIVSKYTCIGEGVQILQGAIVQAGATLGDDSIINSGAIVEHDCTIGRANHLAPGVTLSGQVETGSGVFIGTGANVIQNIKIGEGSVVAAGANILKNIPAKSIVYGYRKEPNKR